MFKKLAFALTLVLVMVITACGPAATTEAPSLMRRTHRLPLTATATPRGWTSRHGIDHPVGPVVSCRLPAADRQHVRSRNRHQG